MQEYFEIFFPNGHEGCVLLVDDDPNNLEIMRFCMGELGFNNFHMASNGREALETFRRRKDEIILVMSDVHMPVMRGDELFMELRDAGARVLLCSGDVYRLDVKGLIKAGLRGFLEKPYTPDQFWLAVANAFAS